jgi:hypothetical protein
MSTVTAQLMSNIKQAASACRMMLTLNTLRLLSFDSNAAGCCGGWCLQDIINLFLWILTIIGLAGGNNN